jgi:hypothetical protein
VELTFPSTMVGDLRKFSGREVAQIAEQVDGVGTADGGFAAILGGCWVATLDRGPYPAHVFGAEATPIGKPVRRKGHRPDQLVEVKGDVPNWPRVLKGDLVAGLIFLAQVSITDGDDYPFDVPCASCGKPVPWEIKLSELEVKVLPEESIAKVRAGEPFETLVAGKKVLFDLQTVGAEEPVARLMKQQGRKTGTIVDVLAAQVRSVEGVGADLKARWSWLADLALGDLQDLQYAVQDVDCGVETGFDVECKRCGYEFPTHVPLDRRLFSPRRRTR